MLKLIFIISFSLSIAFAQAAEKDDAFLTDYNKFKESLFISPEGTAKNIKSYLKLNEAKLNKENKGKLLYMLVRSYLMDENVELATSSLAEYKIIVDHFNDTKRLYNYHNLSAVLFNSLGLYKLSLENLEEAYKIALETQKEQFIVQIEYNIAYQYIALGFYDKAKDYFTGYYDHSQKINDNRQAVSAITQLAIIEYKQGNFQKALILNQKSQELREKINLKFNEHASYLHIGKNYLALNNLALAKDNIQQAKKILTNKSESKDLSEVNLELIRILIIEEDYPSALSLSEKVILNSTQYKQVDLTKEALKLKAVIQSEMGLYQNSFYTLLEHEKLMVKRQEQQQKLAISFLLSQRDGISKDYQLAKVNQEKQLLAAQSQSKQNQLLLIVVFSFVFIGVVLFFIYKLRNKNKQLKNSIDELDITLNTLKDTQFRLLETEKMKAMTTLVSGLAHQMNTPLGIIITAVSTLKDKLALEQKHLDNKSISYSSLKEFFTFASQTITLASNSTEKTSSLIERFKMMSAQLEKTEVLTFEFSHFVDNTVATILQNTQFDVNVKIIGQPVEIKSFHSCWVKILSQLVENSLNHGFKSISNPLITIEIDSSSEELFMVYSDNGKGIETEDLSNVFNPFFTTSLNTSSLGLGLSVIYNAVVHMMGGKIECLDSTEGVCFKITTPKYIDD